MSIEAPPLERKLVAILAADVEGYSRMMHADEEGTLRTLSHHRNIIDGLIAATTGNITSTAGDSVLAEFPSVVEAVNCAVSIQIALAQANALLAAERQMHFRIGINVGDVMVKDGGIFGDGVNVAARVEALAPPGGICVTRGVRDHMRDRVNWKFEDFGDHQVKNIARTIQVFRVIFDEAELGQYDSPATRPFDDGPDTPADEIDDAELTFWKSAELGSSEAEYRAYLERYPNGAFVALAQARLASPLSPATVAGPELDIEIIFWNSIKDSDDALMFQAYLDKYPDGEFQSIAALKIKAPPTV